MPIDITKLHPDMLANLRAEFCDDDSTDTSLDAAIGELDVFDAMDKACDYEGLINYGIAMTHWVKAAIVADNTLPGPILFCTTCCSKWDAPLEECPDCKLPLQRFQLFPVG